MAYYATVEFFPTPESSVVLRVRVSAHSIIGAALYAECICLGYAAAGKAAKILKVESLARNDPNAVETADEIRNALKGD